MSWNKIRGQEFAKGIFKTHWSCGRVAGAYLLAGPPGVGKSLLAMEAAKALNCRESKTDACDQCPSCLQTQKGGHPDVHRILPEGASAQIKIGAVRAVLSRIALRPFSGRFQVVILEGAEAMTDEAANSLLKSLEEPPEHSRFLITTERLSGCLPTILSRCQLIRCQRLSPETISEILQTNSVCKEDAIAGIARLSEGSAARALQIAKRWEAFQERSFWMASDRKLSWLEMPESEGRAEAQELLDDMMLWLRDVAMIAAEGSAWTAHPDQAEALRRQAQQLPPQRCLEAALELWQLRESLEQFANPKLVTAVAREKWTELTETRGAVEC